MQIIGTYPATLHLLWQRLITSQSIHCSPSCASVIVDDIGGGVECPKLAASGPTMPLDLLGRPSGARTADMNPEWIVDMEKLQVPKPSRSAAESCSSIYIQPDHRYEEARVPRRMNCCSITVLPH